jgi:[acyl-carrier-protein] S-malonyltransferase
MKIAFCFAGQGAQYIGMGKDFYDNLTSVKEIYDKFPEIKDLCFNENELLNQTAYAQKAMLLTGFAIATALKEKGIVPTYACGLSLGEYTALAFAETWKIEDAIEIISNRGRIMQNALPLGTTKMAAIIGLDRETIQATLKKVDNGVVEIANYNCPGQIVITGINDAVDKACELLLEAKARRAIPLNVSGAFHSSLLNNASIELKEVLDRFTPNKPVYKIIYNVSGKEETRPLNDILKDQICHSVYFEDSVKYLLEQGVDTFVEIGPGKTLTGFIRKISPTATIYNVSDYNGYLDIVSKLGK